MTPNGPCAIICIATFYDLGGQNTNVESTKQPLFIRTVVWNKLSVLRKPVEESPNYIVLFFRQRQSSIGYFLSQTRLPDPISNRDLCSRRLLGSLDPEAPAALAVPGHPAQHHVSDVRLPAGLRGLVLSQRRHVLHSQDRRLHPLQLRVSGVNCLRSWALEVVSEFRILRGPLSSLAIRNIILFLLREAQVVLPSTPLWA